MLELSETAVAVNALPIDIPPLPRVRPRACKRRRKISALTWASIAAFMSRERTLLAVLSPSSPRIRPTLSTLNFMREIEEAP